MMTNVGNTGLTLEEEFATRERKYSLPDGSDARISSNKMTPQNDPYYTRRKVSAKHLEGVGQTGNTAARDWEVQDRKQAIFTIIQ